MKASISAVAEIGLAVVAVALAALLALPSSPRGLGAFPAPTRAAAAAPAAGDAAAQPAPRGKPVAVAEAAALFGYRAAVPASGARQTASAAPIQAATGLTYIGSVTLADGAPSWMFKDRQANTVLTLQVGKQSGGWKLVQVNDRSFLLESGGKRYSVTF